jgi:hypothetical protein
MQRANGEMDSQAMEMISAMLTQNPDFATLWNFRREIMLKNMEYVGLLLLKCPLQRLF